MKDRYDWEHAFGTAPESFRNQLGDMLDQLEDEPMKKRYKFSTVLLAAALITVLLAGGAFAAQQLGLLNLLTSGYRYIRPLEGAEKLVEESMGCAENEYLTANVDQVIFDGESIMAQVSLTLKDPETYALYSTFTDEDPTVYDYEEREITDEAGTYSERVLLGRKDGKTMLGVQANLISGNTEVGHEESMVNPDGTMTMVLISEMGAAVKVDPNDCKLCIVMAEFDPTSDEDLRFVRMELPLKPEKRGEVRKVKLVPASENASEYFEILSAEASFTAVRGSIAIEYLHEKQADYEPMGIDLFLFDADGNRLMMGNGETSERQREDGKTVYRQRDDVQTFAEMPESIFAEAYVIDGGLLPGRVELKLVPAE